ncbi:MAG: alpha/beta hydrolase [Deltaproteobacteria bacterium]|nr:alpha/beta hydrolase [Deltaproteobacteria bacterium]
MRDADVEERRFPSFDGTCLSRHRLGQGPSILLCNGLGGSYKAWAHQIDYLADRYTFHSWDYRGLYASAPPADPDALRVEDHARDAIAVLDATEQDRVVLAGWSMGVAVALEVFRQAPERVAGLVLMNGVAGGLFAGVLGRPALAELLPRALRTLSLAPGITEALTRRIVRMPETVQWAKRLGLAAGTLDEGVFGELAASFADLDMQIYLRILERLGEYDARPFLSEVDVPTLVVAGERDRFTPRRAMREMAEAIPGAEMMVVPGGTHYVAVEYPELVNLRLEKFLRERGWPPRGAAS